MDTDTETGAKSDATGSCSSSHAQSLRVIVLDEGEGVAENIPSCASWESILYLSNW